MSSPTSAPNKRSVSGPHPSKGTSASAKRLTAAGSAIASESKTTETVPTAQVVKSRRRLSIAGEFKKDNISKLDGVPTTSPLRSPAHAKSVTADSSIDLKAKAKEISSSSEAAVKLRSANLSKVGYVPFNSSKVNQDRFCDIHGFGKDESRAFLGVFDGHGMVGHDASQFIATELPKFVLKQKNLDTDPRAALTRAFVDCNTKLAQGSIDVTFSGSTCVVVYIHGKKLYCCNAGDSRAVLGKRLGPGKFKAIPLSSDHKPERPDEKKRILDSKGRVEACKGSRGEDIGPARVWLLHQEVPGLAMTRSFGDLIAASVGVIARPEIWDRTLEDGDSFLILASDGVWEFITSQEAVDIVGQHSTPESACRALVDESTRRWQKEEEVIDDITCVIAFLTIQ